jgi:hypothetical protein
MASAYEGVSDINSMVENLKRKIRNHSYIDRIASYSPEFRIKEPIKRTYNYTITTSKKTKKYIPYEPGKFKHETTP